MKIPSPPLLIITDRRQATAPLEDILAAAFAAGCRWASIREKDLSAAEQTALARRLLPVARSAGARLTLHGAAELALAAGLDGVHLPAGGDVAAARAIVGSSALVGISVHGAAEAGQLDPGVVDYVVAGPAFETASKPGYGPFLGMVGIDAICAATQIPVIAIGGITHRGVADMRSAGAAGIAVMGGIMRSQDPATAVKALLAALEGVP
jgi:thiamine-phosphate pyrophosphorylase